MIKVYRIEEFVINEIFRPFAPSFIGEKLGSKEYERKHSSIEWSLCQNPEYIIELLEEHPEVKRKVFETINMLGGLDFYKYLDMNCGIIQYLKSETERHKTSLVEMVKQLRESTGMGMMDCKRALIETNYDMEKAKELLKEWQFSHMRLT